MTLRTIKLLLVFSVAIFYSLVVFNNITDYGSNYEFVRHVLMMDSTFPGNHGMWRAINTPLLHTAFYLSIIALSLSLLMWLVAFLAVGGEWFLMWQSKMWNGQDAAFRMFTVVGIVLLIVVQPEGEDQP